MQKKTVSGDFCQVAFDVLTMTHGCSLVNFRHKKMKNNNKMTQLGLEGKKIMV